MGTIPDKKKLTAFEWPTIILAFVTLLIGIWGLLLTNRTIKDEQQTAVQGQLIKGWSDLMKYQQLQDTSLITAITILTRQLELNENAQKDANNNFKYVQSLDMARLKLAAIKFGLTDALKQQIPDLHKTDSADRVIYINRIKEILVAELDNRILLGNDTLSNEWVNAYLNLSNYEILSHGKFKNEAYVNGHWVKMDWQEVVNDFWQKTYDMIKRLQNHLEAFITKNKQKI